MIQSSEFSQLFLEPLAGSLRRQREQCLHGQVVGRDVLQRQVGRVPFLLHLGAQLLDLQGRKTQFLTAAGLMARFLTEDNLGNFGTEPSDSKSLMTV